MLLNYLMITAAYTSGCMLSYQLGVKKGIRFGTQKVIKIIAKCSDRTEMQILDIVINACRETLKAKGK